MGSVSCGQAGETQRAREKTDNTKHTPKCRGRPKAGIVKESIRETRHIKGGALADNAAQRKKGAVGIAASGAKLDNHVRSGGEAAERESRRWGGSSGLVEALTGSVIRDGMFAIKVILTKDLDDIRVESKRRYMDETLNTDEARVHIAAAKSIREMFATDDADRGVSGLAEAILRWGGRTANNNTEEER